MKKILIIAGIALLFSTAFSQSADQIMDGVVEAQKADSSAMDIRMTLYDREKAEGTRRIQTLVLDEEGLTKTITVFLEPASVRDTRFLTLENPDRGDDQWIYLPALRKIKRIAAGEKSGSFMGSDFSYSDMSSSIGPVDDSSHRLIREEVLDGRNCWVVESVPGPGAQSDYGKYISWVDKETSLTARVDFYGKKDNQVVKRLLSEDFTETAGRWYAKRISMETLATGHRTVLEMAQVRYNIPVNPAFFTTTFLETGRAR